MSKCMDFECGIYYLLEFERHAEVICSLNSIKKMGFQKGLRESIWTS